MSVAILRSRLSQILAVLGVAGVGLTACGGAAPASTAFLPTRAETAPSPTPVRVDQPTQASETPAASVASPAVTGDSLRLVPAESGNEARYRVTEQLADLSFPSDAIGVTSDITGMLVVSPEGSIVPEESKFVVDLTSLTSDQSRRDNFIKQRTLETDRFPTAEFVPVEALGLDVAALRAGETAFELVGDLTAHGVTQRVTWQVTASLNGDALTGMAGTEFKFADFGMTVPSVIVVLSVEDRIRLEYDFNFVIETPGGS